MGQAARRKRTRQAESGTVRDTRLGALVRELREALIARARSLRSGMPDTAAAERVTKATAELEALLSAEDADDPLRGAEPAVLGFVADVGAISGVFAAVELDPDPDAAAAIEGAAEQLMAFEELPLGSRLGAVVNDREVAGFVAAAALALGPAWDPFDPDPYALGDLAALAAGLAVARAFLLTFEALVDADRGEDLRIAVEAAGTLLAAADPDSRELVLDDMASPAWAIARAVAANLDEGLSAGVRRFAPQLPVAFAAGAFGADWAAATRSAERFGQQVATLKTAWRAMSPEARSRLEAEPVIAAYAAGLAFAASREGGWRLPWDLPADVPSERE